ncbi:MAG TPA: CBS domain-containing protein [Anaerolineales bacterium]|nr:CBS domain-containing protein [Anaerolineales bacterium]
MKVRDVMTRQVEVIHPQSGLQQAAMTMRKLDVGALPVVKDGRLRGIVTDRDITVRAVAESRDLSTTLVDDVMSRDVLSVREDDDVETAAQVMADRQVRRLPVLDRDGRLTGILSMADLAVDVGDTRVTEKAIEGVSQPAKPRR